MSTLGPEVAENRQFWAKLEFRFEVQKALIDARTAQITIQNELIEPSDGVSDFLRQQFQFGLCGYGKAVLARASVVRVLRFVF